jgi:hypothetical protein
LNRNQRMVPKPMTLEEETAVVKKTGFVSYLTTKFVRAK